MVRFFTFILVLKILIILIICHVCTKYFFNYICVIILENYKFYIYVLCQPFIL